MSRELEPYSQPEPALCCISICSQSPFALSKQALALEGLNPISSTSSPPFSKKLGEINSLLYVPMKSSCHVGHILKRTQGLSSRGRNLHNCSHLFTKTKGKTLDHETHQPRERCGPPALTQGNLLLVTNSRFQEPNSKPSSMSPEPLPGWFDATTSFLSFQ